MLRLHVRAPFAAFRSFTAGSYRPTAPFLTPSAAYGLLLNVAAIESRRDDGQAPMTLTAEDLPTAEVAVGAVADPAVHVLYQQLHNYPVGTTGQEWAPRTKGNKYNVQPIRREVLSDLDACICLRGNAWLEDRIRDGLGLGSRYAPEGAPRYGIPFLGDNNFFLSMLREETVAARWYLRLDPGSAEPSPDVARLTVWIDRQDMSRTVSLLYRRTDTTTAEVPDDAWTRIPPGTPA